MLVVVVLLVTVAMRVAIVTAVVYLLLPRGPLCPHCAIDRCGIASSTASCPCCNDAGVSSAAGTAWYDACVALLITPST